MIEHSLPFKDMMKAVEDRPEIAAAAMTYALSAVTEFNKTKKVSPPLIVLIHNLYAKYDSDSYVEVDVSGKIGHHFKADGQGLKFSDLLKSPSYTSTNNESAAEPLEIYMRTVSKNIYRISITPTGATIANKNDRGEVPLNPDFLLVHGVVVSQPFAFVTKTGALSNTSNITEIVVTGRGIEDTRPMLTIMLETVDLDKPFTDKAALESVSIADEFYGRQPKGSDSGMDFAA